MPIQRVIDIYLKFAEQVFKNPRSFPRSPKYDQTNVANVTKAALNEYCDTPTSRGEDQPLRQPDYEGKLNRRCKTSVLAIEQQVGTKKPYMFRTYDHSPLDLSRETARLMNPGPVPDEKQKIWQVVCACTAATKYFDPMKVGGGTYIDAGLEKNNPVIQAFYNAKDISESADQHVHALISIGTGKRRPKPGPFGGNAVRIRWTAVKSFQARSLDTEESDTAMNNILNEQNIRRTIKSRFNVESGLEHIKLDHWKRKRFAIDKFWSFFRQDKTHRLPPTRTFNQFDDISNLTHDGNHSCETVNEINEATKRYLADADVRREIDECAQMLVAKSDARQQADLPRWEYFVGRRDMHGPNAYQQPNAAANARRVNST